MQNLLGNREENQVSSQSVLLHDEDSIIDFRNEDGKYKSFEIAGNTDEESNIQNKHTRSNYVAGITFALISSFCYASNVVFGKMALQRNPILTPYDINFMRGCTSLFVNTFQAYRSDAKLLTSSTKGFVLLFLCNFFGVLRSYPTAWAYQYISGSKCILIINISPVLIVLMGGLLLSEKVTKANYLVAFGALVGCYILTLSKSAESVPNSNPLLGYIFAFVACFARAATSLMQRILSQIWNFMVFPFYYTITLLSVSFIAYFFFDDLINVTHYDLTDFTLLLLASFGTTFGMITISLGLKYMEASTAAPITNLEVAFAFIADILVFHYQFYLSDFLGASVIFGCLAVHILMQCYK